MVAFKSMSNYINFSLEHLAPSVNVRCIKLTYRKIDRRQSYKHRKERKGKILKDYLPKHEEKVSIDDRIWNKF